MPMMGTRTLEFVQGDVCSRSSRACKLVRAEQKLNYCLRHLHPLLREWKQEYMAVPILAEDALIIPDSSCIFKILTEIYRVAFDNPKTMWQESEFRHLRPSLGQVKSKRK